MDAAIYELLGSKNAQIIIVEDDKEALLALHTAKFLQQNKNKNRDKTPIVLPDFRARYMDDIKSFSHEFHLLLSAIGSFYRAKNPLLIAPISSLLYPFPKRRLLEGLHLSKDDPHDFNAIKSRLVLMGYEIVEIVELPGEASIRGDILDICFMNDEKICAYRLSFFDVICEDIRELDLETQKSKPTDLLELIIPPALFNLSELEYDLLNKAVQEAQIDSLQADLAGFGLWFLKELDLIEELDLTNAFISPNALSYIKNSLDYELAHFNALPMLQAKHTKSLNIPRPKLLDFMRLKSEQKKVTLLAPSELSAKEFRDLSLDFPGEIEIITSDLVVNLEGENFVILSLNNFAKQRPRPRVRLAINELNIGEYIVHSDYGVGLFNGIVTKKILGITSDFISLGYLHNDALLIPVTALHKITRYIADAPPALDRLGKGSFMRLKERLRDHLFAIAQGIVDLAAKRDLLLGNKFVINESDVLGFQNEAGFVLTQDQKRSIEDIFNDFKSSKVMDRFLSGDVGFGKTEVALNAMFVALKNGFQCALIVPTTLLCMQHFISIQKRLKGFKVARLDRFIKIKDRKKLLEDLESGQLDVVVATHAILNAKFKKLGLIVVDEEHRFGVKQKESIKELCASVHLLSMSATPIPRTLNMALSGVKSISQILTPPLERQAVKTFVKEKTPSLLKEAILREKRRAGQVIYVHNLIADILRIKDELLDLISDLKIAILHSQIDAKDSENIMIDFIAQKYDILLCTSIVESGIHLPNANTIIVDDAWRFGLADLHQLRGRVGRGNKSAFCYYLIDDKESLTPEAKKRLIALEKNSFLGSGMNLANQDLEIRGGGNLLGEAQSGHIKGVGFGLYLKMLEDALHQLSGKNMVQNDVELNLQISAFLNSEKIPSDALRLDLYRRLSFCENQNEVYEIEHEMKDRFGELDPYSARFLEIVLIKLLCRQKGIIKIQSFKNSVNYNDHSGSSHAFSVSEDEDLILSDILKYLRKMPDFQ
ncbi:MAG: helicase-related protein [Helicobacter sp.]|nr:helicase-related protein [Helicobacter sp.]